MGDLLDHDPLNRPDTPANIWQGYCV